MLIFLVRNEPHEPRLYTPTFRVGAKHDLYARYQVHLSAAGFPFLEFLGVSRPVSNRRPTQAMVRLSGIDESY